MVWIIPNALRVPALVCDVAFYDLPGIQECVCDKKARVLIKTLKAPLHNPYILSPR